MTASPKINRLAADLAGRGRMVEPGWVGLRDLWLPADAPAGIRDDLRAAFFAGARHLFTVLIDSTDVEDDPDASLALAEATMEAIETEVNEFIQVFELQHHQAAGRA